MTIMFQILLYPGVLWVGALVVLLVSALGRAPQLRQLFHIIWQAMHGHHSLPHSLSIVSSATTIALLPWPSIPLVPVFNQDLWRIWALTEASFLVALLPGLASMHPTAHEAAMREAQVGVGGRVVLWVVLLTRPGRHSTDMLSVGLLLLGVCVALLALPFAANWHSSDHESYVDDPTLLGAAGWAHNLHSMLLIALVATFLGTAPALPWWQHLGFKVGLALAIALLSKRLHNPALHQSAEAVLRFCFLVALPLAVLVLLGRLFVAAP